MKKKITEIVKGIGTAILFILFYKLFMPSCTMYATYPYNTPSCVTEVIFYTISYVGIGVLIYFLFKNLYRGGKNELKKHTNEGNENGRNKE